MRWVFLLVCLLVTGSLNAEPMNHPVTGEAGFWISRSDMETTVVALQERDMLRESNISLNLNLDLANAKVTKLEKRSFVLWIAIAAEGLFIIGGLAAWKLL